MRPKRAAGQRMDAPCAHSARTQFLRQSRRALSSPSSCGWPRPGLPGPGLRRSCCRRSGFRPLAGDGTGPVPAPYRHAHTHIHTHTVRHLTVWQGGPPCAECAAAPGGTRAGALFESLRRRSVSGVLVIGWRLHTPRTRAAHAARARCGIWDAAQARTHARNRTRTDACKRPQTPMLSHM